MSLEPPSLENSDLQELVDELLRRIPTYSPEWTDHNDSDPGVVLLDMFAFLTEGLSCRTDLMGEHGRKAALKLARAARSLAATQAGDCGGGLTRPSFFSGQVLTEEDLADLQDYLREQMRRHNRRLHGCGTVSGLGVSIDRTAGSQSVRIEPGHAIDPRGEAIDVAECILLTLPATGASLLVQLAFAEKPCRPVPATAATGGGTEIRYSRIEETVSAFVAPSTAPAAVPIARLTSVRGRWVVDRRFKACRIK